jgi:hypothetical protein
MIMQHLYSGINHFYFCLNKLTDKNWTASTGLGRFSVHDSDAVFKGDKNGLISISNVSSKI